MGRHYYIVGFQWTQIGFLDSHACWEEATMVLGSNEPKWGYWIPMVGKNKNGYCAYNVWIMAKIELQKDSTDKIL